MNFPRLGKHLYDGDGTTIGQDIMFPGGSVLTINEGYKAGRNFKLRFSQGGDGWWVDEKSISFLIAELLYLQRDIRNQRNVAPILDYIDEDDDDEDEMEQDF